MTNISKDPLESVLNRSGAKKSSVLKGGKKRDYTAVVNIRLGEELRRAVSVRAAKEGRQKQEVMLDAIRAYVAEELDEVKEVMARESGSQDV